MSNPCPRCERPLPDGFVVCDRCASVLAVALRNAAANWDELEAAVARQTAINGNANPGSGPRTLHGPTDHPCHHDSCLRVLQSQIRARNEDPIPGETNHVSFGSLEDAWIVTNTATTWARLIEEESGRPIPPPTAPTSLRADPTRVLVHRRPVLHMVPADRETLCDFSWLPIEFCGCGRTHPTKENAR